MYWTKKKMLLHADKYSKAFNKESYEKLQAGKIPQKDLWKYSSFWYKDFDGMAYKTMLRQLISKWGIMSIEMQEAFEKDMAEIKEDENYVNIGYSTRANNLSLRNKYLERLDKLVKKNGLEIFWSQELKGVEQDINNDLILKCNEVYKNLYNRNLEKMITQGVVEGGFFLSKVKDLQYVCIGPNTEDVHSPNERVSITSLKNTYEYLQELLTSF